MYLLPGNPSLNAVEAYRDSGEGQCESLRTTWHPPLLYWAQEGNAWRKTLHSRCTIALASSTTLYAHRCPATRPACARCASCAPHPPNAAIKPLPLSHIASAPPHTSATPSHHLQLTPPHTHTRPHPTPTHQLVAIALSPSLPIPTHSSLDRLSSRWRSGGAWGGEEGS